ncbi:hypothetical protein UPYG_G00114620 [Umbra pygmaea]|uniref:BICD family-like cargo adapter 1 n=1 Tax=Umbra pygmaea TaxID=75934 RepID=A0ABD0X3K4_UMBPY
MEDSVPFSILNEKLRPRFTAMERLCYNVDDEPLQAGTLTGTSTTPATKLGDEPLTRDDSSLTTIAPENEPELEDMVIEGLSPLIEDGNEGHELLTMAMFSDCLIPLVIVKDTAPDGNELKEVSVSSNAESDVPGDLSTVCEGDGDEAVSKDGSPSEWTSVDRILPDVIRSGHKLNRRRTLGPVSDTDISLDTALVLLQNVARKLALKHTPEKSGGQIEIGVVDGAVLQQALWDRDDALEKKKAMEVELLRSKTDMMLLNNQLLEAVQKRLELAVELETWKDDVQMILQQQLQNQQQQAAEEAQKKPSRLGLLRRTNKYHLQKPASTPSPAPSTLIPGKVLPTPVSTPFPSPSPQRSPVTWKDRLKRGKGSRPISDQKAVPASPSLSAGREEDGFQNIDL